ncbi:MAG: fluoride efflux transporter CrcB [Chloroflexota bacterium]|nr:fluoride efflux transporter CrcB [Chloroflexota bacterium]
MTIVLVALGGAVGATARYTLDRAITAAAGASIPYGTLLINVSGSFAAGLAIALLTAHDTDPRWRLLLVTGFLGGYTTFSAFSVETLTLFERGQPLRAVVYLFSTNALALTACLLGLLLARSLAPHASLTLTP